MDRNKMIIIGLIVVIVALIAGIALMLTGNGNSSDVQVPEGMQVYNFDSAFTMVVKDDVKFLKSWDPNGLGVQKKYYDKEDNYLIVFTESDFIANTDNFISESLNVTDKYQLTEEDGLNVVKVLDKKEKVSVGNSEKHFGYIVSLVDGNKIVSLRGNDLDSLKEMANTVRFTGGNSNE